MEITQHGGKGHESPSSYGFIERDRLLALSERLQDGLSRLAGLPPAQREGLAAELLPTYIELQDLNSGALPLLLKEGEVLSLTREAVHLYLLPQIKWGRHQSARWVLCQYRATHTEPPAVELVRWCTSDEGAFVHAPTSSPHSIGVTPGVRLDQRASRIDFNQMGTKVFVLLQFADGQLTLVADEEGIRTSDWTTQGERKRRRQERHSWGGMETLCWIEERDDSRWQDNGILTPEEEEILLDGTPVGKINGADSSALAPHSIYLASNGARVYRLDRNQSPPRHPVTSRHSPRPRSPNRGHLPVKASASCAEQAAKRQRERSPGVALSD